MKNKGVISIITLLFLLFVFFSFKLLWTFNRLKQCAGPRPDPQICLDIEKKISLEQTSNLPVTTFTSKFAKLKLSFPQPLFVQEYAFQNVATGKIRGEINVSFVGTRRRQLVIRYQEDPSLPQLDLKCPSLFKETNWQIEKIQQGEMKVCNFTYYFAGYFKHPQTDLNYSFLLEDPFRPSPKEKNILKKIITSGLAFQ